MKKILLILLVASSTLMNSQSYTAGTHFSNHTDIFPDSLMNYVAYPFTNETYSLDIFAGPSPDVYFTARGSVSSGGSQAYISITSLKPDVFIRLGRLDSVWVPGTQSWRVSKVAKALSEGDTINSSNAKWDNGELFLTNHSGSEGGNLDINDFVGGDKYIGLKYVEKDYNYNDINHYGWIWVRCTTEDSCYVKEYSSSFRIIAGVTEQMANKVSLFPNPSGNRFYINNLLNGAFDQSSFQVLDVLGNTVPYHLLANGPDLQVTLLPTTPKGIYFVNYQLNGKQYTRKLMKVTE